MAKMELLGSYIDVKLIVSISKVRKWPMLSPRFTVSTLTEDIRVSGKCYKDVVEARDALVVSFEKWMTS